MGEHISPDINDTTFTSGVEVVAADWESTSPSAPSLSTPTLPLAGLSQFASIEQFAIAVVNELNNALGSEHVALGTVSGKHVRIAAISGVASVKHRSPDVTSMQQAMEECLDLDSPTASFSWSMIGQAPLQQAWSQATGCGETISLPLGANGRTIGILSCRWPLERPPTYEQLELLSHQSHSLGEALWMVRRANRSILRHLGDDLSRFTKLNALLRILLFTLLLCGGIGWLTFGNLTYRPSCRATVVSQGAVHLTSPTRTKLRSVSVVAGDRITQGQLLALLDDRELVLERQQLLAQQAVAEVEIRNGMKSSDLASTAIARAEVDVLKAKLGVLDSQINATRIKAPFDGIVLSSHLNKRVGQVVDQGETLLEVAPGQSWELEIEVPDRMVGYVEVGQSTDFAATPRPDIDIVCKIDAIDGSGQPMEYGNAFLARGTIDNPPAWLRQGMQGTTQITVGTRKAWWVLFHRVLEWAHLRFWI